MKVDKSSPFLFPFLFGALFSLLVQFGINPPVFTSAKTTNSASLQHEKSIDEQVDEVYKISYHLSRSKMRPFELNGIVESEMGNKQSYSYEPFSETLYVEMNKDVCAKLRGKVKNKQRLNCSQTPFSVYLGVIE